jgi:F-type H+-transporting ATPase subunit delta
MATPQNNDIARAIYLVSKDKTREELGAVNTRIVKFLHHKKLFSKSADILDRLNKIINKENGVMVVKVLSKEILKEETKKELSGFLKERYKAREIILKEILDKSVIGGMRLEIDDEVIDLTVKKKIKKLQEHLTRKI